MKSVIAFILFFVYGVSATAQNTIEFKGIVLDAVTNEPLPRATIFYNGKQNIFTSDSGLFTCVSTEKQIELRVSYIGYDSVTVTVNSAKTPFVVIKLKPSSSSLNEVEVLPELPPYLFFGSKETQVIDYAFWNDKTLIALYNYHRKKCFLILLDKNNQIVDEQPIAANLEYLYMSCIYKTYAVMSDASVYEIYPSSTGIGIKPSSMFTFYRKALHYIGFYENYFYVFDEGKSKQDRVYRIENTAKKSLYDLVYIVNPQTAKSAGNSNAKIKADRIKATREVIRDFDLVADGDFLQDFNTIGSSSGFIEKQRFKQQFIDHPIYAPLFVHDSSIMVFDFYKNTRLRYFPDGTFSDSLAIHFHQQESWQPFIFQDVRTNKYYTSYLNKEHKADINLLDINSCTVSPAVSLHYPSTKKIKVRKGYVYYLHQPYEKRNNVFLFRQKIEE
jgi:hypothetical protein